MWLIFLLNFEKKIQRKFILNKIYYVLEIIKLDLI